MPFSKADKGGRQDRRAGLSQRNISRRTVVVGAAWVAPAVVAVSALPAAAASPGCTSSTVALNWGLAVLGGTRQLTDPFTRTISFTPQPAGTKPGTTITFTALHEWAGNMRGDNDTFQGNAAVTTFNVGGIGEVGYGLLQRVGQNGKTVPTAADYQTVTFTFPEPLHGLSFSITDIDRTWSTGQRETRDFFDAVALTSPTPYTAVAPSGSKVIGSGTTADPWRNQQDGNVSEDGPGGQIDITFTAPVTTFTIRYWNYAYSLYGSGVAEAPNTDSNQAVFLTRFQFAREIPC